MSTMESSKCVLVSEQGLYVQVMKVNESLRLYLHDTHEPTQWSIQKQDKKRLVLYHSEESSYVLTVVKETRELQLKSLPSKPPLDFTSVEDYQCEIDDRGRGDFYTLKFGEQWMFLTSQDGRTIKEIGLTEDVNRCLYIKDD